LRHQYPEIEQRSRQILLPPNVLDRSAAATVSTMLCDAFYVVTAQGRRWVPEWKQSRRVKVSRSGHPPYGDQKFGRPFEKGASTVVSGQIRPNPCGSRGFVERLETRLRPRFWRRDAALVNTDEGGFSSKFSIFL
jgi:hypothetical protein